MNGFYKSVQNIFNERTQAYSICVNISIHGSNVFKVIKFSSFQMANILLFLGLVTNLITQMAVDFK